MLSRFKKQLSELKLSAPEEYLKQVCLDRKQHADIDIRRIANEVRQKEALSVRVIENADDIIQQAWNTFVPQIQSSY